VPQGLGIKVIGHLKGMPKDNGVVLTRLQPWDYRRADTILHSEVVDEVAICLPFSEQEAIDDIARLSRRRARSSGSRSPCWSEH